MPCNLKSLWSWKHLPKINSLDKIQPSSFEGLFLCEQSHSDIIKTAPHLTRTASHLTNVGRGVCPWSRGQRGGDLWKNTIRCVLPLKHICTVHNPPLPAHLLQQTSPLYQNLSDNWQQQNADNTQLSLYKLVIKGHFEVSCTSLELLSATLFPVKLGHGVKHK